jgi:hypothetical protein
MNIWLDSLCLFNHKFSPLHVFLLLIYTGTRKLSGHPVAQLVEVLRYKSEGRGLDSRWCHWNFSWT